MMPQIRFCRTHDGVRIAYLVGGDGPPIVLPAFWFSHLELMCESTWFRTFFESLAERFTVVYYDKPGCGLSDRDRPAFSLDDQVHALESVVEHLKLKRLALFGHSLGGPPAVAYTVRHPERVAHLILFATAARTPPPDDAAKDAQIWEATKTLIRADWGLGSSVVCQISVSGTDPLMVEWFARAMRESVDPDTAIAMLEHSRTYDLSALLPQVLCPALVMHRQGDQVFPIERGRELAASMPDARFVPLDGSWHALAGGYNEDVLQLTLAFLDELAPGPRGAAHPDGLSEREVQVLRLVAAGKSNREIAGWLVLSPHTVVRHVSNILDKTGVANRAEAAAYAARRGLIE